jgi:hypothetical protein
MTQSGEAKSSRILDPLERSSEIMFGLCHNEEGKTRGQNDLLCADLDTRPKPGAPGRGR